MDKNKTHNIRQILLIASVIFGMFFGAGNLIFPIQLGQEAGSHWFLAAIGFLITGTVVPYLAMLAISVTNSESAYDIAKPVAPWFGVILLILIHLTLGPLVATPRTAATGFTMGIAPFLPDQWQTGGMLIFSATFFILAVIISLSDSKITDWVGKYLTPLFLVIIFAIILIGYLFPMGNLRQPVQANYQQTALVSGFLDGYNTLDGIAMLALSVSVVYTVRGLGFQNQAASKIIAKSGFISILIEVILYTSLILIGCSSLGIMGPNKNGGIALMAIINHYFGTYGSIITGILVILAVFTSAIGLMSAFAHDMHLIFKRFSYNTWLIICAAGSFVTANAGLTTIIKWSAPLLMLIYPFVLTLIMLAFFQKYYQNKTIVYRATILFITPIAILDALSNIPMQNHFLMSLTNTYHQIVPFSSLNLGWILPAFIGLLVGLVLSHFKTERS